MSPPQDPSGEQRDPHATKEKESLPSNQPDDPLDSGPPPRRTRRTHREDHSRERESSPPSPPTDSQRERDNIGSTRAPAEPAELAFDRAAALTLAARRRDLATLRAQNASLRAAAAALDALSIESSAMGFTLALAGASSGRSPPPSPWSDAHLLPRVAPENIPALVVDVIWNRGDIPSYDWVVAIVRSPSPVRAAMEVDFRARIHNQLAEWRTRWADRSALTHNAELAIQFRNTVAFAFFAENPDMFGEVVTSMAASPRGCPEGELAHERLAMMLAAIDLTGEQRARLRVLRAEYDAEMAAAAAMAQQARESLAAASEAAGGSSVGSESDDDAERRWEPAGLAGAAQAGVAAAAGAIRLAAAHNRSARAYVLLFTQVMGVLTWTQYATGAMLMQGIMPEARQFCELACGLCRCSFCLGEGARVAAAAAGRAENPEEWQLHPSPAPPVEVDDE